jgi:chitinase
MQALGLLFFLAAAISLSHGGGESGKPKALMCYFGAWSTYRWGSGHFDVEDIDPFLCTHLVFGFAGLNNSTYTIQSLDPYNDLTVDWGKGAYQRFAGLKELNPELKTLLAIGGWNEGSESYSAMVTIPDRRRVFIHSALEMVLEHNFDGLDLDWEYPGGLLSFKLAAASSLWS